MAPWDKFVQQKIFGQAISLTHKDLKQLKEENKPEYTALIQRYYHLITEIVLAADKKDGIIIGQAVNLTHQDHGRLTTENRENYKKQIQTYINFIKKLEEEIIKKPSEENQK